jgi:hypothetical protein
VFAWLIDRASRGEHAAALPRLAGQIEALAAAPAAP